MKAVAREPTLSLLCPETTVDPPVDSRSTSREPTQI